MKLRVSTLFLAIICVLPLSANAVMIDFRSNGPLTSIRQGDNSLLFTVGLLEVAVYGYEVTSFDTLPPFQTAVDRSESVEQSTNGLTFMRAGEPDSFIDGAGAKGWCSGQALLQATVAKSWWRTQEDRHR